MTQDLDLAMVEMGETQEAVKHMRLHQAFRDELARVRLDLSASPYVNLTDEMCKWVILAYQRSQP